MNESNVGRIDEPDDGIIDIGWEPNRLDVMQPLVRRNEQIGKNVLRNLGLMLVTWHVDPNRAAYLFAGIGVGLDFPDIEGAIRKGGDLLAGTGAVELPTVIATLDGSSVELTLRERHSSMWTVVPQRERISARISSQDDPFAEQFFGLKSALFQFVAREREVPEVSQKQGVLHITELRVLFVDAPYLIIARSPIFLCDRLRPTTAAIGTVFCQNPDVMKRISHRFDLTYFIPINRSNRHKLDLKTMASRQ